jgi:hypothetical protein
MKYNNDFSHSRMQRVKLSFMSEFKTLDNAKKKFLSNAV